MHWIRTGGKNGNQQIEFLSGFKPSCHCFPRWLLHKRGAGVNSDKLVSAHNANQIQPFLRTLLQRERPTFHVSWLDFHDVSLVHIKEMHPSEDFFFQGQTYLFCVFPCSCLLSLYRFIVLVTTMGHLGVLQIRLVVRGQGSRCNVIPHSDSWGTASVDLYVHRLHTNTTLRESLQNICNWLNTTFFHFYDNCIGVDDYINAFVEI